MTDEFVSDFLTKAIRLGGVSPDHLCEFRLAVQPSIAEMVAAKKDINPQLLLQLDAIKSRDPVAARELMHQHLVKIRELFQKSRVRNIPRAKRNLGTAAVE